MITLKKRQDRPMIELSANAPSIAIKLIDAATSYKIKGADFIDNRMWSCKKCGWWKLAIHQADSKCKRCGSECKIDFWDGIIRLLARTRGGQYMFPAGLLETVERVLKKSGYEYEVINNLPETTNYEGLKDLQWIGWELREHQKEAVDEAIGSLDSGYGAILHMPTGSGKTVTALKLIQMKKQRTLIIVHKLNLLKQWQKEIKLMLDYDAGIWGGGEKRERDITVAMIQSMGGMNINKFNFVLVDECHHCPADLTYNAMMKSNARHKCGLSVNDDTRIELKGDIFGEGWIGKIKDAWYMIETKYNKSNIGSYEILNVNEHVESRGWKDDQFAWKPIKSMIRHENNENGIKIKVGGDELILTKRHSTYVAEPYGYTNNQTKTQPILMETSADKLQIGDILVQDDGNCWEEDKQKTTVLDIIQNSQINKKKTHVAIKLKPGTTRKELNMTPKMWWQKNNKGKYGMELSLEQYNQYKQYVDETRQIYTESANGTCVNSNATIDEFAYMMGVYIGNGWCTERRFTFAIKEANKEKFELYIKEIKNCKINVSWRKMLGASYEARCSSMVIRTVIGHYFGGMKAPTKRIPGEWIIGWNENARRQLLQGIIDTDGHIAKRKGNKKPITIVTTSKELAKDLLSLLRSLGVNGSITKNNNKGKSGGMINGRQIIAKHDSYSIVFSKNALIKNNCGCNGTRTKFMHDELKFNERPIRSITEEKTSNMVYDIEMDGHPSFCANGILVHNTATPTREDGNTLKMIAAIGDIKKVSDIKELIKRGILAKPEIRILKAPITRETGFKKYADAYRAQVVTNMDRHFLVAATAQKLVRDGYTVLITVEQIKHGKSLEALIQGSKFIHGKTPKDEREKELKMFEQGKRTTIISTLLSEGSDIPTLGAIVIASGGKSQAAQMQKVGRALRTTADKKTAIIVDIVDNVKWLRDHAQGRVMLYADTFDSAH
jgi:superfamily II DNA or RNA helicase